MLVEGEHRRVRGVRARRVRAFVDRLIAEVDGIEHHGTDRAFHTDRQRDAVLVARGYRVMRITAKTLDDDPITVMVRLTEALLTPLP